MATEVLEVHVIADSTGETAARVARAAQAQFPSRRFRIIRHPRVTSGENVDGVMQLLRERHGNGPCIVLTTLVNASVRSMVEAGCAEIGVRHVDLMGSTLRGLEEITQTEADQVPMRPVGVEADYFTRISAMQFAIRHDDGQFPDELHKADIVLLGASRSGKTPLSMYLGYLGYRTANVPLVLGVDPPASLRAVDPWRLVGLTMDPERLVVIRKERVERLGTGRTSGLRSRKDGYTDLVRVYDEVEAIKDLYRKLGAVIVNTTSVALEENASKIIDIVENRAHQVGGQLREIPGEPRTPTVHAPEGGEERATTGGAAPAST